MISKEETRHIAKLAKLGLSEAEIEKYQKELSAILGYVDKLREADVGAAEPFTHSVTVANVLRRDSKIERSEEELKKLTVQMPQKKDGCLKVKAIFEN